MAEVTETNIRTDVPAENQSVERCLTFESGDMTLFLSINNVTEIINDCAITHLPLVPDYIKGIINLRGQILPVVDNFERGLATVPEESKEDPFVDGMNRIYKQLMTELENIGVKPIEAVGQEFDPNLHNAVMQVESDEYESGVIAQELQKGYTYHDMVVRHSMVGVVQ